MPTMVFACKEWTLSRENGQIVWRYDGAGVTFAGRMEIPLVDFQEFWRQLVNSGEAVWSNHGRLEGKIFSNNANSKITVDLTFVPRQGEGWSGTLEMPKDLNISGRQKRTKPRAS